MFLYFYGLERRFFVDQSDADAKDIIAEVRRLVSLYPDNHSVKRYLGEFLDIAMLAETEFEVLEPIFERQGWELPFSLKYAIGARLDKGERLCADWVLSWFIYHPESNLRTPATRCRDEFLALFKMRFDDRFPDGLKVNKPRKHLKAIYRAASSEFEGVTHQRLDLLTHDRDLFFSNDAARLTWAKCVHRDSGDVEKRSFRRVFCHPFAARLRTPLRRTTTDQVALCTQFKDKFDFSG